MKILTEQQLIENIKSTSLKTGAVGLTAKLWLLPDGQFVSTGGQMHFDWALSNQKKLKSKYDIDISNLSRKDGEQTVRIELLKQKLIRVNYEERSGFITFEAIAQYFNRKHIKNSILKFIDHHAGRIYGVTINLFDVRDGEFVMIGNKSARLFTYDDDEKIDHIPFITESKLTDTSDL